MRRCAAIVLALCAPTVRALDLTPFALGNLNPFVQIYGLPPPQPLASARAGRTLELGFEAASHYVSESAPGESLLIDGETYRTTLAWRERVAGITVGVDLPYVAHRRGVLDDFIMDWHNAFGLDQGGRDSAPTQQLHYRYDRNGSTAAILRAPREGVGDVRVHTQHRYGAMRALELSLKLPTGDSDGLLGSGSTDAAAAWAGQWRAGNVGAYARVGALALTRGDVLPAQQRRAVAFGDAMLAWGYSAALTLKLQLDAHSAFYRDSEIDALGSEALLVTVGGSIAAGDDSHIEIAVVEDALIMTAPDVTFYLRWRARY